MSKKIGIIDCELIERVLKNKSKTFFPNLALMKLSGYHKSLGDKVNLIGSYSQSFIEDDLFSYDKIYVSKIFLNTYYDSKIENLPNIIKGGTGFFYDKSPKLDEHIEHYKPDYNLYENTLPYKKYFKHKDAMIGFITRGCFRKCEFCVNKNFNKVIKASEIKEFWDDDKKYIILLDDNFLGYSSWKDEINKLKKTSKPFQFNQGLDMRIMTEEKADALLTSKYYGDYIFAFDNIEDEDLILKKLAIWNNKKSDLGITLYRQNTKFFLLSAYDREGNFDNDFYDKDIENLLKRIYLLFNNFCKGYVMLYDISSVPSPYKEIYIAIKDWINSSNGNWNSESLKNYYLKNYSISSQKKIKRWLNDNIRNDKLIYYWEEMSWNSIHF